MQKVIGEGNFGTVRLLRPKEKLEKPKDEVDVSWMFVEEQYSDNSEGYSEMSDAPTFTGSNTGGSTLQSDVLNKNTDIVTDDEVLFAGKTMPKPGSPGEPSQFNL